jgi:uncharacterized protein
MVRIGQISVITIDLANSKNRSTMAVKHQIVGRKDERKELDLALKSPCAELIAIYGRRRVGKTFLIRQHFRDQIIFETVGLHDGNLSRQLANFHASLRQAFPQLTSLPPRSWLEAFELLREALDRAKPTGKTKRVLFFDEFPWMETRGSGFVAAFEAYWNQYASQKPDMIVVVCGSAAAWMMHRVIRAKGGLHNRLTRRIRLMPFSLGETDDFLRSRGVQLDAMQIAQVYMTMGGIPHYLNHIRAGKSAAQNIEALCFRLTGMLRDEYDSLLTALFDRDSMHQSIVKVLATSWKGLARDELIKKAKLTSGGRVTQALEDLILSGFVQETASWNKKKKEAVYRLVDEFSIFYWTWMQHTTTDLHWMQIATGKRYDNWCGYAFENLCFKHLDQIKRLLGISGIQTSTGTWSYQSRDSEPGAQIDLLIDRADRCFNLVEVKFSLKPFVITKAYASELETKIRMFREKTKVTKPIFLTMITPWGIEPNRYSIGLSVEDITLQSLMND